MRLRMEDKTMDNSTTLRKVSIVGEADYIAFRGADGLFRRPSSCGLDVRGDS